MKSASPSHYSYRVDHDLGFAPHIWRNTATLCGCKSSSIEQWALAGSWVVGIGGKGTGKADKLIYVMRVTEVQTYACFRDTNAGAAAYLEQYGFPDEKRVLISHNEFFYFGDRALKIPDKLRHIIHPTQGCKRISEADVDLLKDAVLGNLRRGIHGQPNNQL